MIFVWGEVSGDQDLGVVAERCPDCKTVTACSVTGITKGVHVFFVPVAAGVTQAFCTCGGCGGQFVCKWWQYKQLVPASQVPLLTIERLLELTNPTLKEELAWSSRLEEFASDSRFATALRSLEELPTGGLSTKFRSAMRHWSELDEVQRNQLVRMVDESVSTMKFAKSIAPRIPDSDGWMFGVIATLAVWSASLAIPAVRDGRLWWVIGAGLAGLMAGVAVFQLLLDRQVRRWTNDVLVPEGRQLNINFRQFIDLLDDLPQPSRQSDDAIRSLQEQAGTIREVLLEIGEKGSND